MTTSRLLAALTVLGFAAAPAVGQVILSDSFNREVGSFEDVLAIPPVAGDVNWGSTDNGLGGTVAPIEWIVSGAASEFQADFVNGEQGILQDGRALLNYNLAADADIIAANGVRVTFDVNPGNTGLADSNGRDWGGLIFADTNSTSIGTQFALAFGNADSRTGFAARNSGTGLARFFGTDAPPVFFGDGNPDGGINEAIFDADTFAAYEAAFNSNGGDPLPEFVNENVYNVQLTVTPVSGDIFATGAEHLLEVAVGINGGPLVDIDANLEGPETFFWGDNISTAVTVEGEEEEPRAFIAFVGNNANNAFDNLLVSALAVSGGGIVGDYDDSGQVEQGDLNLVLNNWGTAAPFDPNGDPFTTVNVDQEELNRVLNNWGSTTAPSFEGAAVPEPATAAVLAGLGLLGLRRRRRNA